MVKRKLNVKWVTEAIGEDYKNWRQGDIVSINAQTGTGKTYFIKNKLVPHMDDWESMLIVCNRVNLKRQLKKDLFDYYNLPLPESLKELDEATRIGEVTIMSYQQIAEIKNKCNFGEGELNLDKYTYIVCDECHFFLTDAAFNNNCDLAFESLINSRHRQSVKIFISATMDEIKNSILKSVEKNKTLGFGSYSKCNHFDYDTRVNGKYDYSYLNTKYFNSINDIVNTIKSDESDDKWLIFISNKEDGKYIIDALNGYKKVEMITKDTNINESEDLQGIINESKFKSDILICTKALDNGINIEDEKVRNVVIMAWDKVTFIQELGRKRINIEDAQEVNLFIWKKSKKAFNTLLLKKHEPKNDMVNLFSNNINEFMMKYNRKKDKPYRDLFYLNESNEWKINTLGYARLIKDINFANKMKDKFNSEGENAYIIEQLEWLDLSETFNENDLLEDVVSMEVGNELKEFLESAYNDDDRFTKEYFIDKVNSIIEKDKGLQNILAKTDNGQTRPKGAKKLNELFNECGLSYLVSGKRFKINGKLETKWIITIQN